MLFVYNCLIENLFFPDIQHNIIWIDPYQHAGNSEQENVGDLRQAFCGIFEERIRLEFYAV